MPHGRIVVLDGHQFSVDVNSPPIRRSQDPGPVDCSRPDRHDERERAGPEVGCHGGEHQLQGSAVGRTPSSGSDDVSGGGECIGQCCDPCVQLLPSTLPVIIAAGNLGLDRTSRPRRRECGNLSAVSVWGWCGGSSSVTFIILDFITESIGLANR